MSIHRENAIVVSQEQLAPGIYSMWFASTAMAAEAIPGQFVSLYTGDNAHLLPRPISICEIDREKGQIRLVYRVAGYGTEVFSGLQAGEKVLVMGPLGNGYREVLRKEPGRQESKVLLIAGGIGIPPLLQLAKEFPGTKTIVLGYRDSHAFLAEEFSAYGKVLIATEDGSRGTPGNVLDAIRQADACGDLICSCGPTPMLRAVKEFACERGIPAWVSLEERMACGVGACLGCVCRSTEVDAHSHVANKRVCKDGPVFEASEVEIG